MRKNRLPVIAALLLAAVVMAVGAALAQSDAAADRDKIERAEKSAAARSAPDQKLTSRIGIFPPGFGEQAEQAKADYELEYGLGGAETVEYRGYTIIVPPAMTQSLDEAKAEVDEQLASQSRATPTQARQRKDRAEIRRLFGTDGEISYDPPAGAYADGRGYQYKVVNGVVVAKQIGVSDEIRGRWLETHPGASEGESTAEQAATLLTDEEVRGLADALAVRALPAGGASEARARSVGLAKGRLRAAFDYGEVKILVDRVSGEIVHYSRESR